MNIEGSSRLRSLWWMAALKMQPSAIAEAAGASVIIENRPGYGMACAAGMHAAQGEAFSVYGC